MIERTGLRASLTYASRSIPAVFAVGLCMLVLLSGCQPESSTPFDTNTPPEFVEFNYAYWDTLNEAFVPVVPRMGIVDTLPAVDTFYAHVAAVDEQEDSLRYVWWSQPSQYNVVFENDSLSDTRWFFSGTADTLIIGVTVTDALDAFSSISDTLAVKIRNADGSNVPPVIEEISSSLIDPTEAGVSEVVNFEVTVDDPDGSPEELIVSWSADAGLFSSETGTVTQWTAPSEPSQVTIDIEVSDGTDTVTETLMITVVDPDNLPPEIVSLGSNQGSDPVYPGDTLQVQVIANDPDGANTDLVYEWFSTAGEYLDANSNTNRWIAPEVTGDVTLTVEVSDDVNTVGRDLAVSVQDPPFVLDFSSDQVTGLWDYGGLLFDMGDAILSHEVSWDGAREKMAMTGHTNWAHPVYYLDGEAFGNVTMEITVSLPNPDTNADYSFVGFVPKFANQGNYFAVGINYFLGGYAYVLRGENNEVAYLNDPFANQFVAGEPHTITYSRSSSTVKVWIDGILIWQGAPSSRLDGEIPLGICVNGNEGTPPALFDDLSVTTD